MILLIIDNFKGRILCRDLEFKKCTLPVDFLCILLHFNAELNSALNINKLQSILSVKLQQPNDQQIYQLLWFYFCGCEFHESLCDGIH